MGPSLQLLPPPPMEHSPGLPKYCENMALQPCLGNADEHRVMGLVSALKAFPLPF